jgi:hypothetical protein
MFAKGADGLAGATAAVQLLHLLALAARGPTPAIAIGMLTLCCVHKYLSILSYKRWLLSLAYLIILPH